MQLSSVFKTSYPAFSVIYRKPHLIFLNQKHYCEIGKNSFSLRLFRHERNTFCFANDIFSLLNLFYGEAFRIKSFLPAAEADVLLLTTVVKATSLLRFRLNVNFQTTHRPTLLNPNTITTYSICQTA